MDLQTIVQITENDQQVAVDNARLAATLYGVPETKLRNMSDTQLRRLENKHKRLLACGQTRSKFDAATGAPTYYQHKCEQYQFCPKCMAEKAVAETLSFKTVPEVWRVVVNQQGYDALKRQARGDETKSVLKRYEQADGTMIVYLNFETENTERAVISSALIQEELKGMKPGARISGALGSAPIVERKKAAPKKKQEDDEEKSVLEMATEIPDSVRVEFRSYNVVVNGMQKGKFMFEVWRETLRLTGYLDPDHETLQWAIEIRQRTFERLLEEIAEKNGISYKLDYYTDVTGVKTKKICWKQHFESELATLYGL